MKYCFWFVAIALLAACKKDLPRVEETGFPAKVNTIVSTRCATEGCHNAQSKEAAGGLSMETWDEMMKGGNGGAVVIPYRSDRSLLHFYVNTFPDLGVTLSPTMPYNQEPLARNEVLTLMDWIYSGAPNANGLVAFSGDANRSKFYVTNQGCDEIAVVDSKSKLVMRYISVGTSSQIESPHSVKVSPDKRFAYVVFALGIVVQKIDCASDEVVGSVEVGLGLWNSLVISPDGKTGIVTDWQDNGQIKILNLETMSVINTVTGMSFCHGLMTNPDFTVLYGTKSTGNILYRIDIADLNNLDLTTVAIGPNGSDLGEHEIVFTPDGLYYFVSCSTTAEIRVMQASNDSLISVLPCGQGAVEMAISQSQPYLFVTCLDEPSSTPKTKGAVYIYNYNTFQFVKSLQEQLYQPHGIALDDANGWVLVTNRNLDITGPTPHHTTDCAGRAGYMRAIDLNSLEFVQGFRPELSVDPYGAAARAW